MGPEGQHHQHYHRRKAADGRQQLADPEIAPVEAVHPQAFDEGAAQAVPGNIAQGDLAVVLPTLAEKMQQHEARGVPHGFIQEGGMVILHFLGNSVEQAHAEKALGSGAEGLPVKEIAPASHTLADEEAQGHQIQQRRQLQLFHQAQHRHADGRAQHTAVDGQAALPDVEHRDGVVSIALPGENAVVGSGASNGKGGDPQHAVQDIVFCKAEGLGALHAVPDSQQQAAGNHQAIEIDGQRAQVEAPSGVHFQTQPGERNGRIIGRIHIMPPSTDKSQTGSCAAG